MTDGGSVLRRRILGLAFFLVLALFLVFTIGMYNKSFKEVVKVNLVTDSVGNSLPSHADVKVRGLIVGEVRSASTEDGKVTSVLAIDPDKAELIPSNATARLLPKTLFGERYVSLIVPTGDTAAPISQGDTLLQDKSGNAIEVGELLDGLLPLLQAVPPQDLANTLGALSQALAGRGNDIGLSIERLETIFAGVNTELPNLQEGLRGLADFSQTYSEAAPDLINAFDNLRTTGATVVQQQNQIRALMSSVTATAGSTADFLEVNKDSLISIAADSREALEVLAAASPTFGCTFSQFVPIVESASAILGLNPDGSLKDHPGARAATVFVNPKGRYLPNQDEPRLFDNRGAKCYQPAAPGYKFGQYPGGSYNDGSYQVPSRNPGPSFVPSPAAPQYSVVPSPATGQNTPAAYTGSTLEQDTLAVIYGKGTGTLPEAVPGWTTLLGAPALRGTEVSVR
ncbi:phospholipid/cholesterol/gamma-HCH transport system substrate-binding protein [Rhodococcus sp. PvR044]|jgi:phospholipid/cholesterol/gamma-HCH transport system substrate-binding protein|uniref:MCE family protein n=1 Tax=unclassified Rhodococcus (in: high G+C Gram-positive bacteria) TaxID=192944 RepID=UPI000BCEF0C5|nr:MULTISPECIES: MCE family protein [unclassified Rhodococcus (in: high G+C Gram-positive bacteria)]MBP1162604.1 virulence factor Mce-like protein [Rhodococcus sp. PvR099]PTR43969.1 virulence factor Mce-like protein [Rhodococcus sp. OK611]SNX90271.1 virulence factor Mce family protein [Rhodococcus sp. OK270]